MWLFCLFLPLIYLFVCFALLAFEGRGYITRVKVTKNLIFSQNIRSQNSSECISHFFFVCVWVCGCVKEKERKSGEEENGRGGDRERERRSG